jgi:rhodanese-related sulfurtransferase
MKGKMLRVLLVSLTLTIVFVSIIGCTAQEVSIITAQEAFALIKENEGNQDFVIIDVRTPEEFVDGHLENALNINLNSGSFSDDINKLNKNKPYLIYCRSGNRSAQAAVIMKDLGFKGVYDMGGINDWITEGFPIVK